MDDAALKALLEKQDAERMALAQQLEDTRLALAKARAEAEINAPGLRPPGMLRPALTAEMLHRHVHNLRLEDEQKVARADAADLAELARRRAPAPGQAFNEQAADKSRGPALPASPAELARQEENRRFRDEHLQRFGLMQGRERGLGRSRTPGQGDEPS